MRSSFLLQPALPLAFLLTIVPGSASEDPMPPEFGFAIEGLPIRFELRTLVTTLEFNCAWYVLPAMATETGSRSVSGSDFAYNPVDRRIALV
jgi:hypothetical protein